MRCVFLYQLAFLTPGIIPWSAILRKQMRHSPNLRYTARGRPHNWQRRRSLVENFGFCFALASLDALAMQMCLEVYVNEFGVWVSGFLSSELIQAAPFLVSFFSSALKGKPRPRSSSRDSSLLLPEITIVTFMPCTRVNLSGLSSGNTSCSDRPKL